MSDFINTKLYAEIESLKEENSSLRQKLERLSIEFDFFHECQDATMINQRGALKEVVALLEASRKPGTSWIQKSRLIKKAIVCAGREIERG